MLARLEDATPVDSLLVGLRAATIADGGPSPVLTAGGMSRNGWTSSTGKGLLEGGVGSSGRGLGERTKPLRVVLGDDERLSPEVRPECRKAKDSRLFENGSPADSCAMRARTIIAISVELTSFPADILGKPVETASCLLLSICGPAVQNNDAYADREARSFPAI